MCFLSSRSREKTQFFNQRSQNTNEPLRKHRENLDGGGKGDVQILMPLTPGPLVLPQAEVHQSVSLVQSLWWREAFTPFSRSKENRGMTFPSSFFPKQEKKKEKEKETQSGPRLCFIPRHWHLAFDGKLYFQNKESSDFGVYFCLRFWGCFGPFISFEGVSPNYASFIHIFPSQNVPVPSTAIGYDWGVSTFQLVQRTWAFVNTWINSFNPKTNSSWKKQPEKAFHTVFSNSLAHGLFGFHHASCTNGFGMHSQLWLCWSTEVPGVKREEGKK